MHATPKVLAAAALSAITGCSTTFSALSCASDDDCGAGLVCGVADGQPACLAADDAPITIGMSAPVTGPNQELGVGMRLGISLAFEAQNAKGGVRGRPVRLDFRDDAYEPPLAERNARALLDVDVLPDPPKCPTTSAVLSPGEPPVSTTALASGPGAAVALLGDVGTPTMLRAAPVALETGTLFFGPFTGATELLRDGSAGPCARWLFNVRASYADEARAALEYFFHAGIADASHLVSFDQADSFGQSGYDGLVAAYEAIRGGFSPPPADPANPIHRFRYSRDDAASVPAQVSAASTYLAELLAADDANHVVGVFMTATYGPATTFITQLRQWQYANDAEQQSLHKATRLTLTLLTVSPVGPNALAERLVAAGSLASPFGPRPYTDGVVVSQVVPNYETDHGDGVRGYRKAIDAAGETPSFTSLEGYLAALVFLAGLEAHEGPFTPDALVPTFESLPDLALGLGAGAGFSPSRHGYSTSVWGTSLDAGGAFQDRYYWAEGTPLSLFE